MRKFGVEEKLHLDVAIKLHLIILRFLILLTHRDWMSWSKAALCLTLATQRWLRHVPCSQELTVSRSLAIKKEKILCSGRYILKISNLHQHLRNTGYMKIFLYFIFLKTKTIFYGKPISLILSYFYSELSVLFLFSKC